MFGGKLTIDQYREDFLIIEKHDWVLRYFNDKTNLPSTLSSIASNPIQRSWTYHIFNEEMVYDYPRIKKSDEQKKSETITPPIVKSKSKPRLF